MTVTREQIVAEAYSWLRTPYAIGQMVKGGGCDCGTLLLGILVNLGLAAADLFEQYRELSPQWYAHTNERRYLVRVMQHAKFLCETAAYRSTKVEPGCLLLVRPRTEKNHYHGGIVTAWPKIIHCVYPHVQEVDVTRNSFWAGNKVEIFDPLAPKDEPAQ